MGRRDGPENVGEMWGLAARSLVEVRVQVAEVGRVERRVENSRARGEVKQTRLVGQYMVEREQLGSV